VEGLTVGVAGGSEAFSDGVVVDDQVTGLGVLLDVGVFAGGWWSHDEGDVGGAVHPSVVGASVDASVVALVAGGSKVSGVELRSAFGDGDDVVDLGGEFGAAFASDLALPVVSLEDLESDLAPGVGAVEVPVL
jgi:hypothetical protein